MKICMKITRINKIGLSKIYCYIDEHSKWCGWDECHFGGDKTIVFIPWERMTSYLHYIRFDLCTFVT